MIQEDKSGPGKLAYTAVGILTGLYLLGPIRKIPYVAAMVGLFFAGWAIGATDFIERLIQAVVSF